MGLYFCAGPSLQNHIKLWNINVLTTYMIRTSLQYFSFSESHFKKRSTITSVCRILCKVMLTKSPYIDPLLQVVCISS